MRLAATGYTFRGAARFAFFHSRRPDLAVVFLGFINLLESMSVELSACSRNIMAKLDVLQPITWLEYPNG